MRRGNELKGHRKVYIEINHKSGVYTPLKWYVYTEMLTKKQLKVIDAFRKNLKEKLTAEQIKQITGIKSNNFLYKALSNCLQEGVLTTQSVGRSLLYTLEINHTSSSYLGMIGFELYNLPIKILKEIETEVSKKTSFFTAVVFGSYAKGKPKKESDLDIALIVQDKREIPIVEPVLESIKRREILSIHPYVFSASDFTKMLEVDEENLGKQIVSYHIVFYNPDLFYNLIKPWIH